MNLQKFRALLARAILLPLLLAILLGAVLFWAVRDLNNAAALVDRSDQVISQTNSLLKLIVDMETGLRAFVITGDELFLQPYNEARPIVSQQLEAINRQVSGDPQEQQDLAQIQTSFEAWRAYSLDLIGKRKTSAAAAQDDAITLQGKQMMDALRGQVADFLKVQEDLRQQRQRRSRRAAALLLPDD